MARTLSEKAQVAKAMRQYLKAEGFKGRCTSKGSSVDVTILNPTPEQLKQVEQYSLRYKAGHFDGMQDMYIYNNTNDELPQVRFIFVHAEYDDSYKQKALDMLYDYYGYKRVALEDMPYLTKCGNTTVTTAEVVWQTLMQSHRSPIQDFWARLEEVEA